LDNLTTVFVQVGLLPARLLPALIMSNLPDFDAAVRLPALRRGDWMAARPRLSFAPLSRPIGELQSNGQKPVLSKIS
jgi:hypothetical protein